MKRVGDNVLGRLEKSQPLYRSFVYPILIHPFLAIHSGNCLEAVFLGKRFYLANRLLAHKLRHHVNKQVRLCFAVSQGEFFEIKMECRVADDFRRVTRFLFYDALGESVSYGNVIERFDAI